MASCCCRFARCRKICLGTELSILGGGQERPAQHSLHLGQRLETNPSGEIVKAFDQEFSNISIWARLFSTASHRMSTISFQSHDAVPVCPTLFLDAANYLLREMILQPPQLGRCSCLLLEARLVRYHVHSEELLYSFGLILRRKIRIGMRALTYLMVTIYFLRR